MKKKVMSLLLVLVMALTLLPAQAWAADDVTSGTCGAEGNGSNLTWNLSGGVLTISGTGAMKDWEFYGDNVSPWKDNKQITRIVVEQDVTTIGDGAFYACSKVTSVQLPTTLKSIGYLAFYFCADLKAVDIPDGVTTLRSAFQNCRSLTAINVPSSVTDIAGAFATCVSLTSVTLPEGLTEIGNYAFSSCESLTSIKVPSTVTFIGRYAFEASAIQAIDIPNGVTEIGESAFSYCPNLTELVIPDSVVKIGHNIVEGSSKLRSVHLGKGVENIFGVDSSAGANEFRTFQDCESLTYITVDPDNHYYTAEDNVLFNKAKTEVYRSAPGKTGSYTLPSSVKTMENTFIFEDSQLSSIVIPEGVQLLPQCTFKNCTNLKKIWLPKSLHWIGLNAFVAEALDSGVDPIEDVYYAGSEDDWNSSIIFADGGRPSGTVHYNAETPLLPGCPTGGDKVQIQDVAFAYEYLTGQRSYEQDNLTEEQWNAMDVNSDETVDVYDLQAIYELAVGLR